MKAEQGKFVNAYKFSKRPEKLSEKVGE